MHKYTEELLAGLYNCLQDGDMVEIIQVINSLYDRKQDAGFILSSLGGRASKDLLLYYAAETDVEGSSLEKCFLAGRYDAAAVLAAYGIQNASRLLVVRQIEDGLSQDEAMVQIIKYRQNVLTKLLGSRFVELLDLQSHLDTMEGKAVQRTLSRRHISQKNDRYAIIK